MLCKNFVLSSEFDGLLLHGTVFVPEGEKKGALQILHGMCEYKERYESFMRYFAERGFVVVCHDQRGHGDSVRSAEDRGYFYETRANGIVEDATQITRWLKAEYPNLPVSLFGHSMGSMVARCYLQKYDTLIDKAIICGSPSKNPLADTAIALDKCIALFYGKRHRSKLLSYLSTGKGNDNFPNEEKGAWLSSNRENVNEFYANPKGNYRFTCNGFENLFRLMKKTYQKKLYRVQNENLPILFVSGADDAVLGGADNFQKTTAFMKKVGYKNVTGKLYAGLRHEIHNEKENLEVLGDLLSFVEKSHL